LGVHEVQYLDRTDCGTEIASFRFSKPDGYTFEAGQYAVLSLDTAEGRQSKPFTHAQAPGDAYLEVTTRLSGSAFKNALAALEPGARVSIRGPQGRLVSPPGLMRVAFLVGGVGITPARSILRDRVLKGEPFDDAVVFFGNRDESCIPYREELDAMGPMGVRVVNVLERPPADWGGEAGFVSAQIVRRHLDTTDGRMVIVSGPPVMVVAMERVLDDLGVDPARRVIERFMPAASISGA
jgi:ferredoxin-NADP reductase